jgi:hypothetical protein
LLINLYPSAFLFLTSQIKNNIEKPVTCPFSLPTTFCIQYKKLQKKNEQANACNFFGKKKGV